jgi:hypothetical protein
MPVNDPVPRLILLIVLFVQLKAWVFEVQCLIPINEDELVGEIEIFEKLFWVIVIVPPPVIP